MSIIKLNRRLQEKIIIRIGVLSALVVLLFPIYWMLVSSFRQREYIQKYPPNLLPSNVTLNNYIDIFTKTDFFLYFRNSFFVATITVAFVLFCGLLAGYSFSRFRHKWRNILMVLVMSVQMFPLVGILIPLYTSYVQLNLTNSFVGLMFAHAIFTLPFAIWFLKGFYDTIPRSIDESGYIDGCTRLGVLFRLIIPLLKPAILAVTIFTFLKSWDDYLFCLTLNTQPQYRNLPVGIAITSFGEYGQNWGYIMAISSAAVLIPLLAFIFLQRYMVSGLVQGAVKE